MTVLVAVTEAEATADVADDAAVERAEEMTVELGALMVKFAQFRRVLLKVWKTMLKSPK